MTRDEWNRIIAPMYDAADDHEANVLDSILVKAGQLRRCDCGDHYPLDFSKCENCGAKMKGGAA